MKDVRLEKIANWRKVFINDIFVGRLFPNKDFPTGKKDWFFDSEFRFTEKLTPRFFKSLQQARDWFENFS